MPEEEVAEQGQVDEPTEPEIPSELPEDPAERASALEAQLAAERKARRNDQRELERARENAKEQEAAKKTWYQRYEEAQAELAAQQQTKPVERNGKPSKAANDSFWYDDNGKPKELMDFVTEGVTVKELFEKAGVVTREELKEQIEARVQRETTQARTYQQLVADYPDLADANSSLMRETADMALTLQRERPELTEADRWELAAARAARKINYVPKPTNGKPEDTERERRERAQGGPIAKPAKAPKTIQITDADRALAKQMNGGVPVPDKDILASLKRLAEQRELQQGVRAS